MEKSIINAVKALQNREIVLYPTDTVWGIGCDATNFDAVSKIYKIKQREESKSLIILIDSLEMLKKYVEEIPKKATEILKLTEIPTTIIYKNPVGLATNIVSRDNSVAIRIVKDDFCKQLIKRFGKPIVSTSANISGESTPKSFIEISNTILRAVDYVINLQKSKITNKSSAIIRITETGEIEVIRK